MSRQLLRDQAHAKLLAAITSGQLAPGARLRDTELESWLKIGRTPIREALARLEASRLVVTTPGRSTTVSPIEEKPLRDTIAVITELMQLAARLGPPRMGVKEFESLRYCTSQMDKALKARDTSTAVDWCFEFHLVFAHSSDNEVLVAEISSLLPLVARARKCGICSPVNSDTVSQQTEILAALEQDNEELATRLLHDCYSSISVEFTDSSDE